MYKLKKDGVVRIVATDSEAERWKGLGYEVIETAAIDKAGAGVPGSVDPLAALGVDQLKEYAKENGIDIGNATSQNGILKKIRDVAPLELKKE